MIVVVGSPRALVQAVGPVTAAGLASGIAVAAAAGGAAVQFVGKVGEDTSGEGVLLDLARRGVGHVAVLRDVGRPTPETLGTRTEDGLDDAGAAAAGPARDGATDDTLTLDAADVELALRYLPEYAVIVVAERLDPAAMRVVADAAGWNAAALVVVGRSEDLAGLPDDATVLAPPDGDPDGAFAAMVGTYAAALDRGDDPRAAFAAATAAVGSNPVD